MPRDIPAQHRQTYDTPRQRICSNAHIVDLGCSLLLTLGSQDRQCRLSKKCHRPVSGGTGLSSFGNHHLVFGDSEAAGYLHVFSIKIRSVPSTTTQSWYDFLEGILETTTARPTGRNSTAQIGRLRTVDAVLCLVWCLRIDHTDNCDVLFSARVSMYIPHSLRFLRKGSRIPKASLSVRISYRAV